MTATATPGPGVTATPIVDSGVVSKGQGYGLTRVYDVSVPQDWSNPARRFKVRVAVDRNAYDTQSSYTARVWTEMGGWQTVTHVEPQSPEACAMPSYVVFQSDPTNLRDPGRKERHERAVNAAEAMAARLLSDALLVLL